VLIIRYIAQLKYGVQTKYICVIGIQRKCPYDGDFKCKDSGRCMRARFVCNGRNFCSDGSDEQNCSKLLIMCKVLFLTVY